MGFSTLVVANIGLTLVNRSFTASVFITYGNNNQLLRIMLLLTIGLFVALLYKPLFRAFFHFAVPSVAARQFGCHRPRLGGLVRST